jgi:7-carboxy-7-deazaguanine synthase (Cx14CxxC type)
VELANAVAAHWPRDHGGKAYVVCTGGEPLLQLDSDLVIALHSAGMEVAIESNGTMRAPAGIDWICVSPKADAELALVEGDELKLVYPQVGGEPERYAGLKFAHFFLQPMDGPDSAENTRKALRYCLRHPQWRLSLQTHKLLGIP